MPHHINLFQEITSIIQVLAWPIVVLTIFLNLKTPLINIINRIKKIGYKDTGIEMHISNKQGESKSPIDNLTDGKSDIELDSILNLFAPETLDFSKFTVTKQSNLEALDTQEDREKVLLSYSQIIFLFMHFNKIYYNIFGSQIRILQRLSSSIIESRITLLSFYNDAKSAFPKVFENYPYDTYLNYLLLNNLITEQGSTIVITPFGKDFLKYLIDSSYSLEKPF
jgi:hypothetical protein